MGNNELLKMVKASGEDFEWYPTTNEIIKAFYDDLHSMLKERCGMHYPCVSLMDIGAGNGKLFNVFNEISEGIEDEGSKVSLSKAYAIEKSMTLVNALDENVFVVGTDFWGQTLIDKKVDVIYCNPPYSEYVLWAEKIIKEANSEFVYLLVPDRWEKEARILEAAKKREVEIEVVGSFSFLDAEDRKARAHVNLLRIDMKGVYDGYGRSFKQKVDPFKLWFEEMYAFDESTKSEKDEFKEREEKRAKIREVVRGGHLVERLEELYNRDMAHLHENYVAVSGLDGDLLKELGVSQKGLMEALQKKIEGLKYLYWKELFDNLDKITSRLTKKSRESLLGTLMEHTSVDFSAQNAYAIVIWVVKNANKYFDKQLLDLYGDMTKTENIRTYKSNQRAVIDDWRYLKEEMSHYALDYRIVLSFYGVLGAQFSYQQVNGLGTAAVDKIGDIITVASNLGFDVASSVTSPHMRWESNHKNHFYLNRDHAKNPLAKGDKTLHGRIKDVHFVEEGSYYQYLIGEDWYHGAMVRTEKDIFMEVKAFKNGNIHIKFHTDFMKALNIEAARLNKWIKSPQEACEEFDISESEAKKMFGSNFVLGAGDVRFLLPSADGEVEHG